MEGERTGSGAVRLDGAFDAGKTVILSLIEYQLQPLFFVTSINLLNKNMKKLDCCNLF
jgi:hypothetical protein